MNILCSRFNLCMSLFFITLGAMLIGLCFGIWSPHEFAGGASLTIGAILSFIGVVGILNYFVPLKTNKKEGG